MAKAPADRQASRGSVSPTRRRARSASASRRGRGSESRIAPASARSGRSRSRLALVAGIVVSSVVAEATHRRPRARTGPGLDRDPQPDAGPPAFRTVDRALSEDEERLLTYLPEDVSAGLPAARSRRTRSRGSSRRSCVGGPTSRCCTSCSRRGTRWTQAFQVNVNNRAAPHGECATDHLAVVAVLDRRRAGRPGPVLHGRACHERGRHGSAAEPVPHRMDGRQQLHLRACGPERPRRPQPVRLVAVVVRPGRLERRRHGDREGPTGLARTSTSRRVLHDLAHATGGEPVGFTVLFVVERGDGGGPSQRWHLRDRGQRRRDRERRALLQKPNAVVFVPEPTLPSASAAPPGDVRRGRRWRTRSRGRRRRGTPAPDPKLLAARRPVDAVPPMD